MRFSLNKSFLQAVIQHRNGYLVLASGSLLLNILLGLLLLSLIGHERIVIVPPTLQRSFWLSYANVSPEYLAEMSLFFASLRLNVTSSNATSQHALLLHYVDPHVYEILRVQLFNEREHIGKEHISTVFYPVDVRADAKNFSVLVTGDFISTVSMHSLPAQRVTYRITYRYNQGRLWVASFEEVKTHV